MLKTFSVLATLVIIFLFSACKKSNDSASGNVSMPKTFTEELRSPGINTSASYNLSYDGSNRLISMSGIPEPSGVKYVYNYATANTYTMDLLYSGEVSIHEEFWLNSSSLVDSTWQYNNTGDTTTEKYIYGSLGQLNQIVTFSRHSTGTLSGYVTDYSYDNAGNLTQEISNQGSGISYTYYTDLSNNFTIGKSYFQQPKYYVKTSTNSSVYGSITATHFYSFDNNNRLIKDSTSYTGGNGSIEIKSYTY
jgi:YD repeat-containing protein